MKRCWCMLAIGLFLVMVPPGILWAQGPPQEPVIDPEADTVLREMSEHLKKINAVVFRVADTIDDVQADGRKLQFAHVREITVVRPDKLKVDVTGDVTNRTVWIDGKTITVLDKDKKVYAQIPDPGTLDQAVDLLQEKYNMSLPGADLLADDAYKAMTEKCEAVNYIGLGFVGEEKCHHLAFARDDIDWQLWVTTGKEPAPRKLVITYKRLPGEPQYTQQLLKREDPGQIQETVFKAQIPEGTQKIEFYVPAKPQ